MRLRQDKSYTLEKFGVWVPKSFVRFFRERYLRKEEKYRDLEKTIVSSRIPVSVPRYLAISYFYPLILSPLFLLISYFVSSKIAFYYASYKGGILPPEISSRKLLPFDFSFTRPDVMTVHFSLFLLILVSLFFLCRWFILLYPKMIVSQRRAKIDASLPHVVNIMLGMVKGGTPFLEILKTIAEERPITGEVGKEFAVIMREVTIFHRDLISAMRHVALTTPSKKLSEFLEDLIGVVEGGGKLTEFFEYKSAHYIEERERYHEVFLNSLEVMAEVYVAIFVVAPLFTLIVFIVLGMMGEEIKAISNAIVYGFIPIGGLMFIWLIKSMLKTETPAWVMQKRIPIFLKVKVDENERKSEFTFKRDLASMIHGFYTSLRKRLRFSSLLRKPEYSLIVTIPASLIAALIMYRNFRIETIFVTIFVITCFPYALLYEYRSYILRKLENHLPDFLKQLGSLNESGLTLVAALRVISSAQLGALSKEVMNIRKDVEWGKLISEAFERFEERVGSSIVSKVVSILVKALQATDNVKSAIFTAASDAEMYLDFRKRVANEMFVYTVIVYVTFAVFLFTIVVLDKNFIAVFGNITIPSSYISFFTIPSPDFITRLFYHATLLNGFFSGLVAGIMGSGSLKSGIKHSLMMVVTTLFVFGYYLGLGY